jgi:hypothetical protein
MRRVTKELNLEGGFFVVSGHTICKIMLFFLAFFEPPKMDPRAPYHDQRGPYVRYCNYVVILLASI